MSNYERRVPYDAAAGRFRDDYRKKRPRIERTAFCSFEARRKDLLSTELSVAGLNLVFEFDPLSRLATIIKHSALGGDCRRVWVPQARSRGGAPSDVNDARIGRPR